MLASYHPSWLSWVSLAAFLLSLPTMTAAEPAPSDAGITVEARGPIHEAYAQPVTATPQPGLIVNKQPPDPIPEEPPEQKPALDNVIWIPGYWAWDTDRSDFLWVSGFWRVPPEGRHWVPATGTRSMTAGSGSAASGCRRRRQRSPMCRNRPPRWTTVPACRPRMTAAPGCPATGSGAPVASFGGPASGSVVRGAGSGRPPRTTRTPCGYAYVDGYSDYPLADRGLLFAPVSFTQPLWTNPDWSYTPNYCVDVPGLLSSFWVRPSYGHYYFGDYYGAGYARQGFSPWTIVRPAQSRSALRLLPLAQRTRLLPEPERHLRRSEQRRSGAPGADAGGAQPSDREAQQQLQRPALDNRSQSERAADGERARPDGALGRQPATGKPDGRASEPRKSSGHRASMRCGSSDPQESRRRRTATTR